MEVGGTHLLTVGASIAASIVTVIAADFFGLRRDRAKMRMEFAWQLRRQRWDAVYEALNTCPRFSTEPSEMLKSIIELTVWSSNKVEPWIDREASEKLQQIRSEVEEWVGIAAKSVDENRSVSLNVPTEKINSLRNEANKELAHALQKMRGSHAQLIKEHEL
ncbi:hypothetical protein MWU54_10990 [Marivita sp. S6314]|uniref:hypothetical protein n=1 Tax=Marivita sp. S6314 TaxID=2926406 RepID=UPI001FF2BC09|nr:hypothetical protein [Marivita sp. S6314]MCK0150552.1 hypothetical protein [Marivita sp. S6314]